MGRVDANPPPQPSDQTPLQATPQATSDTYQNNNHPHTTARSFVPQSSPESMPPSESYPPQKPSTYPPQQPAAAYPPEPTPVQFPPQQEPVQFSPQQEPVQFPPQQEPVQFPPPQQNTNASAYTPQSNFNYAPQPQPTNYVGQQFLAPTQGWTTDIFDCAEDPENAIITACLPCITFGQIAEIVDNGQTSCETNGLLYGATALIYMSFIVSCSYRTKIRSRYGLMESPGPDWMTHFFCEWCALCQEYRELKARGLDPDDTKISRSESGVRDVERANL